jgi:hypothetical protein
MNKQVSTEQNDSDMFTLPVSYFKNKLCLTVLKTVRLTDSVLHIKHVLLFLANLIGTLGYKPEGRGFETR